MEPARPSKPRLLLFAFGDFAFNLYWQSVMLFLLFYYTDALDIPIAVAATTYMVASVWDGIANFVPDVLVDRRHGTLRLRADPDRRGRAARALLHADLHAAAGQRDAGRSRACSARICCSARPMPR